MQLHVLLKQKYKGSNQTTKTEQNKENLNVRSSVKKDVCILEVKLLIRKMASKFWFSLFFFLHRPKIRMQGTRIKIGLEKQTANPTPVVSQVFS